jgi:hypothetical protein
MWPFDPENYRTARPRTRPTSAYSCGPDRRTRMRTPWDGYFPVIQLVATSIIYVVSEFCDSACCCSSSLFGSVQCNYPNRFNTLLSVLVAAICMGSASTPPQTQSSPVGKAKNPACPNDDSGLKLPAATVFAEGIAHARHMVVAPNGVLYVNTWSGRYYGNDTPPAGGFLVAL